MTWCDKLASTPGAGVRLDWHFVPASALMASLSSILDDEIFENRPNFEVSTNEPYGVTVRTNRGYTYSIDPQNVGVNFQHRLRAKQVSAGPPIMEMLSKPMPYTKLLPEVKSKLVEAALLVSSGKDRKITRVGIVATTILASDVLPPGIARFVEYIGRPWNAVPDTFQIQITATLSENPTFSERCVHTLNKAEGPDDLIVIQFDWQKTFIDGRPLNRPTLETLLNETETSALKYFETLAEGNQFDEDIIRTAANV